MRGELVALDLETTGLDVESNAIIEVGAVRIKNGEILEEFSTLVNPGFEIPADITHLTGIHPEDVVGAPTIDVVLPKIAAFVGRSPVIAHSVGFDLTMMQRHGILKENVGIDTYDLAAILLPHMARYTLGALTDAAGISLENAHRALDDARATALLYWHLWQRALSLPHYVISEINRAASSLPSWETGQFFRMALEEHAGHGHVAVDAAQLFEPLQKQLKPLQPIDSANLLDINGLTALAEPDGVLAKQLSGYEQRTQQVEMIRAIAQAFNQGEHLMIEAGTGTGKSLAYLLPAVYWSMMRQERVVIATNTINLQDQLINKDIPLVKEILGEDFCASVIKGRGNYLCPRRLSVMRYRPPTGLDELRVLAKVLVWLQESKSGDKGEVSLRGPRENVMWQRLSAEDEGCSLDRCSTMMQGTCPFYKARKTAEAAHILVANHALLISDAALENQVLPDYRYAIIDEAHQLEEAITNGLTFRIDKSTLLRRLEDLGGPNRGLLGELLASGRKHLPDKETVKLESYAQVISEATDTMRGLLNKLFKSIRSFLVDIEAINESTEYQPPSVRIIPEHRGKASFAQMQTIWNALSQFFDAVSDAMRHLTRAIHRMETHNIPGFVDITNSTEAGSNYLNEVNMRLRQFFDEPDSNTVYWINIFNREEEPAIFSAPLHVGPMVEQYIWQKKESVILTSATLQTESNFGYIGERLSAENVKTLDVGSPFNYRDSTLIYIPTDMPEPNNQKSYQRAVERAIIELAAALNGRVMVLFTSYAQLRETAQNITPRLALGNITVYDQIDANSRESLLKEFKANERAVLLGTRSFWQGVDVPGEALSALVIVRLPFAVPNEPVFAARSEMYGNAFKEFALPDAILRFRQGFGRLIRSHNDRGIVTILDSRVKTKGYGANFLDSLPDCTVQQGPLEGLPQAAQLWLKDKSTD